MAKGIKYGGRESVNGEPKTKTIAVRESVKPDVERFRNLLDDPDIKDVAISFLNELESMSKESKKTTN